MLRNIIKKLINTIGLTTWYSAYEIIPINNESYINLIHNEAKTVNEIIDSSHNQNAFNKMARFFFDNLK